MRETPHDVIDQVDWNLLNDQRLALISLLMSKDIHLGVYTLPLDGVVNLLDALCDAKGVS